MEKNDSHKQKSKETLGILILFFALFSIGSQFSFVFFIAKGELMGPVGQKWASLLFTSLGLISFIVPVGFFVLAFRQFSGRAWVRVSDLYAVLCCLCLSFLMQGLAWSFDFSITGPDGKIPISGFWGDFIFGLSRQLLGMTGSILLFVTLFIIATLGIFSSTLQGMWDSYKKRQNSLENKDNKPMSSLVTIDTQGEKNKEVPSVMLSKTKEDSPQITPHVPGESLSKETKDEKLYLRGHAGSYEFPSLEILSFEPPKPMELDKEGMYELASRLEKTLLDYQVRGKVTQIHPGPVVTMYEFVPDAGVRLSKITALSNDLAMALEALKVRIVAPIPGKAAVGIEVPNRYRQTVYLKEILSHESFISAKSKLTLALGKDISGRPSSVDLAKMPHLLVAGTTGSGKSVAINVMIASLLFRASPDEVKLLMIDPKMLELSIYEGIPHLLLPVITEPKKANLALRWVVDEMERRYALIATSGLRDINSYNRKVEMLQLSQEEIPKHPSPIRITIQDELGNKVEKEVEASMDAVIAAGGVVTEEVKEDILESIALHKAALTKKEEQDSLQKLPYIVVIIDEFADLMMIAAKEVEISVARIAQKARAAGIHLVLATQRPSVDVITGLIKANFPSRIAFQVASRIDSRTILDAQGAESLLGMGDMLLMDRGQALFRVHGALVTDQEIHRLVDHLKKQGDPIYNLDILAQRDLEEKKEEESFEDEMYNEAISVVRQTRQASISLVQRKLRIGYNRAARLIEQMEKEGIVSPPDGAKGREVL